MLHSYLKVAFRNLIRNKTYSIINILGLSLGVGCCLLLSLYIQDELSYDRHHKNLDRLFRITTSFQSEQGLDRLASTSPPVTMTMREEIAGIQTATRLLNPPGVAQNLIKYSDNIFYEPDGLLADSTLFEVLSYELSQGNPAKALTAPNSVVISERLAQKLFGNEPALDKIINISQGGPVADYKITGVFKEDNRSYIKANFFISITSNSGWAEYIRVNPQAIDEWAGQNFVPGFVVLQEGTSKESVEKQMNDILVKYGAEDMKALGFQKSLGLEPVKDIYLKSDIGRSPRVTYLYVIAAIAVFILIIACINFMNLSTAKATKRATEIGVRKVMGAFRSSLVSQILGEAMVIVAVSIVISIILVQLALPWFNVLTGKSISFNTQNIFYFIGALTSIAVVTGLLAGSYPAFYLSSFQPAQVLKGKMSMSNSSGWLRRGLVIFQFMIAIVLGCGMLITFEQLNYMQEKDLGFDQKAKIVLPLRTNAARENYESLKQEISRHSGVHAVSGAEYVPGSTIWSDMSYYAEGGNMDKGILFRRNTVDHEYINLMNIKLLAGRAFTDNHQMDSGKVVINRAGCNKLGIQPADMVGEKMYFDWQGRQYAYEVIGVIEDYHQNSLKEEINPVLFELPRGATADYSNLIIDTKAQGFQETIEWLEGTWKKLVNDTPFEFAFLDQNLQKQYEEDQKVSQIITSFTFIALAICCLGLYGLSTYMAERRIKEIGVRKVLGASVNQIVTMMNLEFVKLVGVAFVISVPLAWYAMDKWLSGFAYKTPIGTSVFVYAGMAAFFIAILTVSYESLKAASSNPVNSLRNE
jgi:putative ABC transport system permease protein